MSKKIHMPDYPGLSIHWKYTVTGILYILLASFLAINAGCSPAQTQEYSSEDWKKNGITSLEEITLNGLPHSVLIRGTDRKNPILLVIHGYGVPMMPFAHLDYADKMSHEPEQGALEKNFILVHYDQRGTGKTARHRTPEGTMTTNQYIKDAEELIKELRTRFHQDKIYLMGISWGSMIGIKLISKHPEWFHAYISEGQVVNMPATYKVARDFALTEAENAKNLKAISELKLTSLPDFKRSTDDNINDSSTIMKWADHYNQILFGIKDLQGFFFISMWRAPEYTFMDFLTTLKAIADFTKATTPVFLKVDLHNNITETEVPIHFIIGEHDAMLPPAHDFFNSLKSDYKKWYVIKGAGHSPSADRPLEVLNIILKIRNN
jgi:pimeloyl-ACP methyl ester carboxylesterase